MLKELKKNLMEVYVDIKSTDDLYRLEKCLSDIHEYILFNCNKEDIISVLQDINKINKENINKVVNSLSTGNTEYILKEVSDSNLYKEYQLPKEGNKFKWEILDSYELVGEFRKLKSFYNIKYDDGLALLLNGKHTFRFIRKEE